MRLPGRAERLIWQSIKEAEENKQVGPPPLDYHHHPHTHFALARRFAFISEKRPVMEWHVRCSRVQINGLTHTHRQVAVLWPPQPWPIAQDEEITGGERQSALRPASCITAAWLRGGEEKMGRDTLHVMLDPFLFGCRSHGAATTHQLLRSKHPHDHRL